MGGVVLPMGVFVQCWERHNAHPCACTVHMSAAALCACNLQRESCIMIAMYPHMHSHCTPTYECMHIQICTPENILLCGTNDKKNYW